MTTTVVQAESNSVTVVVNETLNKVSVVQPQTQIAVVRDNVVKGPLGPQGPQGPGADQELDTTSSVVFANVNVTNALNVAGDISIGGNLIIGNVNTDTVQVIADFTSNLIPDASNLYSLGAENKRWNELYINEVNVSSNLSVAGNLITRSIIPDANIVYDIGTPEARFRDLWLSNNTIHLGDAQISSEQEDIVFNEWMRINGSSEIIYLGNLSLAANGFSLEVSDNAGNTIVLNTVEQKLNANSINVFTANASTLDVTQNANVVGDLVVSGNIYGNVIGLTGNAELNNLIFTETETTKTLTGYRGPNGETYVVRTAEITGGVFSLTVATFTPTLSAVVLPSTSLSWDVAATGIRATVINPADFATQYISNVDSFIQSSGNVSTNVSEYTTTGPNVAPTNGVSWNQTFSVNENTIIGPTSTTLSGGSASGLVRFKTTPTSSFNETLHSSNASFSVNWSTPSVSISMTNLSGYTFLQSYTSTSYSVSTSGISNSQNILHTVTPVGGTISSSTGSGTFTFTNAIHKDNTGESRTLSVETQFTRPAAVTGTEYTANSSASDTSLTASFTYPSFWVFTNSVSSPPTKSDIVNGTSYKAGVTTLGNQAKTFGQLVNNTEATPRVFWFGVRAAASQPSTFQTGASSSLLSGVSTTNSTVALSPDNVPGGYNAETYNLYGIVLQPGSTYVSIS